MYFISTFYLRTITWTCNIVRQDNCSLQMRHYTVGMEHALATFCSDVFVRPTLPDERTSASRRPCGPVYITSPICAAYCACDYSPICVAYRPCDCLACPCSLTMPRPTHLSALATDSAVIDFSFTMVIINFVVDIFWPNISG